MSPEEPQLSEVAQYQKWGGCGGKHQAGLIKGIKKQEMDMGVSEEE